MGSKYQREGGLSFKTPVPVVLEQQALVCCETQVARLGRHSAGILVPPDFLPKDRMEIFWKLV